MHETSEHYRFIHFMYFWIKLFSLFLFKTKHNIYYVIHNLTKIYYVSNKITNLNANKNLIKITIFRIIYYSWIQRNKCNPIYLSDKKLTQKIIKPTRYNISKIIFLIKIVILLIYIYIYYKLLIDLKPKVNIN